MRKLIEELEANQLFLDWKTNHSNAFLSHSFCQVDSALTLNGPWEIGFYDLDNDKITTFYKSESGFIIKPEEEVFKKPGDKVEELKLPSKLLSFEEAKEKFEFSKLFPGETLGDGFVILQTLENKVSWNATMISKTLKFLNIKIDAITGEEWAHQAVELVSK